MTTGSSPTGLSLALLAFLAGSTLALPAFAQEKGRPDPRAGKPTSPSNVQPSNPRANPAVPTNPNVAPGAGAAPAAPAEAPTALPDDRPPPPAGTYRFPAFSEPVDVTILIDMVAERLKIQLIATDVALREKKINLRTPIDVKEEDLLGFLSILLEQVGQFITKDKDIYFIKPGNESGLAVGGELANTQVLPTKGLRPSSLQMAIQNFLRNASVSSSAQPGMPAQQGPGALQVSYLDDLGVLVITDTPRRIEGVKNLIDQIAAEQIELTFTRFPVAHLSAATARTRILEMIGVINRTGNANPNQPNQIDPNNPGAMATVGAGGQSSNIGQRLIPDTQSNALILRGHAEEAKLIRRLLTVVDTPNALTPKWYGVGPAAQALAEQGKRSGLGEVTVMQTSGGRNASVQNPGTAGSFYYDQNGNPIPVNQNQGGASAGGPTFILDADQRGFIYYGTPEQHAQLDKLVKEFEELTKSERVVYEFYKLKFADAEKTADLIRGMINNTVPGGEAPLIPGAGGAAGGGRRNSRGASMLFNPDGSVTTFDTSGVGGGSGLDQIVATEDVHVLPDKSNNQIIVKAPQRMQPQFQRLIDRVDQRRAQVYIDAKIIVVGDKNDFAMAIETQFAHMADTSVGMRTAFGLSTLPTGGTGQPLLQVPLATVGQGLTTAVIRSKYVPFIINATQTTTGSKIVASPQLLVDDNEEAELTSINEEPTTTRNVSGTGNANQDTVTFSGYQEAGPKLKVKPRISTGDLLSVEYSVELSSFTGAGSAGVPPPRQTSKVSSKSVTIPSDSTIVVGGLTLNDARRTVLKIPLIGDIPIIGDAFKKTTDIKDERTVYILLTPRIMRDPLGNDLRLFSRAPLQKVNINPDLPPVKPEVIPITQPGTNPAPAEVTPVPAGDFAPPNNNRPVSQ